MSKQIYKVEFSIDGLSLAEQNKFYNKLINILDEDQRYNLHITITDAIGGKHHIWDNKGFDPNGKLCRECKSIDCEDCSTYIARENIRNGKNADNTRSN